MHARPSSRVYKMAGSTMCRSNACAAVDRDGRGQVYGDEQGGARDPLSLADAASRQLLGYPREGPRAADIAHAAP